MSRAVIVMHGGYGCDTGCCGHRVLVVDPVPEDWAEFVGDRVWEAECVPGAKEQGFDFAHPHSPPETFRGWAEDLIAETMGEAHVADLDWDHCLVLYE
jgi:hypothetical protein